MGQLWVVAKAAGMGGIALGGWGEGEPEGAGRAQERVAFVGRVEEKGAGEALQQYK